MPRVVVSRKIISRAVSTDAAPPSPSRACTCVADRFFFMPIGAVHASTTQPSSRRRSIVYPRTSGVQSSTLATSSARWDVVQGADGGTGGSAWGALSGGGDATTAARGDGWAGRAALASPDAAGGPPLCGSGGGSTCGFPVLTLPSMATTRSTLGWSKSLDPAPKPQPAINPSGTSSRPMASIIDLRSATPVGVHSSPLAPGGPGQTSSPSIRRRVAGAGTGSNPWSVRTYPRPRGSGEALMLPTPRWYSAEHVPTVSTILSTAPTSWKCTDSGEDAPCVRASATARR
mmetsp:Transcript_7654/g.15911  ORF Transcript_7654/g.15911 Transcript_7654/m.15911 type:complete len:288 (-) Transcript_7654:241-1104(-)